jgi:hypothetical protein
VLIMPAALTPLAAPTSCSSEKVHCEKAHCCLAAASASFCRCRSFASCFFPSADAAASAAVAAATSVAAASASALEGVGRAATNPAAGLAAAFWLCCVRVAASLAPASLHQIGKYATGFYKLLETCIALLCATHIHNRPRIEKSERLTA